MQLKRQRLAILISCLLLSVREYAESAENHKYSEHDARRIP